MREIVVLGNVNVDLILGPLGAWPAEGTEALVDRGVWRVGGNAGNAAVALAALGARARLVSTVGQDLPGQWLRANLRGLSAVWHPVPEPTSVTVAVTHPGGERSFLTHLGHLAHLGWSDLRASVPSASLVLLAGGFLTPCLRRDYPALLRELTGRGAEVALDPGWPDEGFTGGICGEMTSWLTHVTHLLINELEARSLTGEADPSRAGRALAGLLPAGGAAVVKLGAQGALAVCGDEEIHVPAPTVRVIDTVGAGDTFNAAYLHARLGGGDLRAALEHGVQVASRAISTSPRVFVSAGRVVQ